MKRRDWPRLETLEGMLRRSRRLRWIRLGVAFALLCAVLFVVVAVANVRVSNDAGPSGPALWGGDQSLGYSQSPHS